MSEDAEPILPASAPRRARITNGFKFGSCCLITSMFVWVGLLIALEYTVHTKIIFLDPPIISQANVPYYTKISSSNAALANVGTLAYYVYTSDSWLILPVLYVPGAYLMATILPLNIWITGLPIVMILYSALELFKSGYFTFYWFSGNCQKYPFCIPRSGPDLLPADPSFVWETVITYVLTVLAIVVTVLSICVFYSGRRERETLIESRKCFNCGEKPMTERRFQVPAESDLVVGAAVAEANDSLRRRSETKTGKRKTTSSPSASSSVLPVAPPVQDVAGRPGGRMPLVR